MKSKNFNLKGFKLLLQSTEKDLLTYLGGQILSTYGKDNVDINSSYIFGKGDLPVLLVAHMDTVHDSLPTRIYFDEDNGSIWSPQGIGGDDRCGVYSILYILNYFAKNGGKLPSVLFTTQEEVGCIGASVAAKDLKDHFISRIKFAIELDRRGENDCVFYACANKEFQKMVESHGFVTAIGSSSDIARICPAWDIAGVNLSIGYEKEHSKLETVNVDWMMATVEKAIKLVKSATTLPMYKYRVVYKFLPEKKVKHSGLPKDDITDALDDDNFDYKGWGSRY